VLDVPFRFESSSKKKFMKEAFSSKEKKVLERVKKVVKAREGRLAAPNGHEKGSEKHNKRSQKRDTGDEAHAKRTRAAVG
jgi:hypothetical protein